jgi:hypothetical protein
MSTLDSDFGFEAVMRESALASAKRAARTNSNAKRVPGYSKVGALAVLAGLAAVSTAVFALGYSALLSDTPAVWIHRLMALAVAQSILIAGVAMKLLPVIERRGLSVRIDARPGVHRLVSLDPSTGKEASLGPPPPPLPEPRKPVIGGVLAGREYLIHGDGSIEIDTLVGRRRFVSIEAAREFVGS